MDPQLVSHRSDLVSLTKTDPDPRVRHRAHCLVCLMECATQTEAARHAGCSVRSFGRLRTRYLADGRDGLSDRSHPGRPCKLPPAAREFLATALESDPGVYGYPVTTWTIADLTDLLARRGWVASSATVNRMVHRLDYVHRRPRHDLHHRQDLEAVASAERVLSDLQKRGLLPTVGSGCSISMNASFTPIPTWQRSGSDAASPVASRPPGPTSG